MKLSDDYPRELLFDRLSESSKLRPKPTPRKELEVRIRLQLIVKPVEINIELFAADLSSGASIYRLTRKRSVERHPIGLTLESLGIWFLNFNSTNKPRSNLS
jgi:hypothetical protein